MVFNIPHLTSSIWNWLLSDQIFPRSQLLRSNMQAWQPLPIFSLSLNNFLLALFRFTLSVFQKNKIMEFVLFWYFLHLLRTFWFLLWSSIDVFILVKLVFFFFIEFASKSPLIDAVFFLFIFFFCYYVYLVLLLHFCQSYALLFSRISLLSNIFFFSQIEWAHTCHKARKNVNGIKCCFKSIHTKQNEKKKWKRDLCSTLDVINNIKFHRYLVITLLYV